MLWQLLVLKAKVESACFHVAYGFISLLSLDLDMLHM